MRHLALAAVVILGVSQSVSGLPQGRGVPPGRASRDVAPSLPWRETLALAADWRWFCPYIANGERNVQHTPDHREIKAFKQLNDAFLTAAGPAERRAAVVGLARIGSNMTELAGLYPKLMLENDDPSVRSAAADAIGLSFDNLPRDEIYGVSVAPPWNPAAFTQQARLMLETRLKTETTPAVAAAVLRSMARLPLDVNDASLVELVLGANLTGNATRVAGAIAGLEILARRAPSRPFALDVSQRLRDLAEGSRTQLIIDRRPDDPGGLKATELLASLRRLALLVLHETNRDADTTLVTAMYDGDWQVRRMAAEYLPARDGQSADELLRLLSDDAFQVRAAALTSLASRMRITLSCGSLIRALDDTNPAVVMTAIDVAPENCSEKETLVLWLRQRAMTLGGAEAAWQVPARALMGLVRLKDSSARSLNARFAATHAAWQVRQLAARLALALKDESVALLLTDDKEPNVRAAAFSTLTSLDSAKRMLPALANLKGTGSPRTGPLLLAAANALPDDTPVEEVRSAMEAALAFATDLSRSREVTIGLIGTYRKFPVGESRRLRELIRDSDPAVARAAAAALTSLTGVPVAAEPKLRMPAQPSSFQLRNLPRLATLELSNGGALVVELLTDDAPLTVAAFARRWRLPYHDAFIDVSPGIGVRSGGVYDNALDGWFPPMRDELGEQSHTRGTVAMMSNGHDLANGEIFIDLIDRPDLDHAYTVFARIVKGIESADSILQGVEITRVRFVEQ
jgi:peptidyl-prolyl cis-trans isomerase B (cyclophilin B)